MNATTSMPSTAATTAAALLISAFPLRNPPDSVLSVINILVAFAGAPPFCCSLPHPETKSNKKAAKPTISARALTQAVAVSSFLNGAIEHFHLHVLNSDQRLDDRDRCRSEAVLIRQLGDVRSILGIVMGRSHLNEPIEPQRLVS